ncbi:MAG: hypothetical protein V2J51_10490 [Erythrobacter sp.]|jgi:hypothetical protein|nr:hypothetical protein [Erythrobacter sp.]
MVVRERLWRTSNPALSEPERQAHVDALMDARRAIAQAKRADDAAAEKAARACVHAAKLALGERGAVWWDDGAPDENRKMIHNSSYAGWWQERERDSSG